MEKVFVTGANGYLGAQICKYLSQQGYRVTGLCWPQVPVDKQWQKQFEQLVVFDIRDEEPLKELAKKKFDSIVHLVSLDHFQSNGDKDFVTSINVEPAENLLRLFSAEGLKKFIYFSTIHVYGKNLIGKITEEFPTNPHNRYAETHYQSEEICRKYAKNTRVNCIVARLSNSYGVPVFPNNNCWWLVVNDLCRQAFFEKKIILQSDGSPLRDFIHGSDVCRALKLLLQKGTNGETYHISSGITYAILELAEKVQAIYQKLCGEIIPVSCILQENIDDFEQFKKNARYQIDNTKLLQLGFSPEYTIEKGIAELFGYLEWQS